MIRTLTHERLLEMLAYDPATGKFTWRHSVGNGRPGAEAGCVTTVGGGRKYVQIAVDKRKYYAQSLAVVYVTGQWPEGDVGFLDGDGMNTRYDNLIVGTRSAMQHKAASRDVEEAGVRRKGSRFVSQIKVDMRKTYLGTFDLHEQAATAYLVVKHGLRYHC